MTNIVKLLDSMRGASFLGLDYVVKPVLTGGKKNPMQGLITKRHNGASVMLFTNEKSNGYENMVHRRLLAEGKDPASFELSPRKWGTRVPGFPIIAHTKAKETEVSHYLECIFLKSGTSEYFFDGEPIAKEETIGLPADQEPAENVQAGLENLVVIRSFALSSIVQMRINQLNVVGPFHFTL